MTYERYQQFPHCVRSYFFCVNQRKEKVFVFVLDTSFCFTFVHFYIKLSKAYFIEAISFSVKGLSFFFGGDQMISNQLLLKTLESVSEILGQPMAVLDRDGTFLAESKSFSEGEDGEKYSRNAAALSQSPEDEKTAGGDRYVKVMDSEQVEYIIVSKGASKEAIAAVKVLSFQLSELLTAYRERFDRDNFMKNLLLDNLLLVDIYNRAKKLHVELEARRAVLVVEIGREKTGDELDRIKSVAGQTPRDFVTCVDEENIIVVKELSGKTPEEEGLEIERTAEIIIEAFSEKKEPMIRVAYGNPVDELKDVSRSYKEAAMALDVGKIFFSHSRIVAYSVLGIGRLIYQLPLPLCRMFIREIFGDRSPDDFDEETLSTINKFFENSLNVSETSRQLYIHRNTLVYRLDKLQRQTGLDLRVFEDAITFKIALMVVEYMKYMEDNNF